MGAKGIDPASEHSSGFDPEQTLRRRARLKAFTNAEAGEPSDLYAAEQHAHPSPCVMRHLGIGENKVFFLAGEPLADALFVI